MWQRVKQLVQLVVAIVSHAALATKVVVIGWDELGRGDRADSRLTQQVTDLTTQ
jgi:hypothetical protein